MMYKIIRRILKIWDTPPNHKLWKFMHIVSIEDLPYWLIFPYVWIRLLGWFRVLKSSVASYEWYDLTTIYPRFTIWGYLYQLFFYIRFVDIESQVYDDPRGIILAETFLRYICEIDDFIDSVDSRTELREQYATYRKYQPAQPIIADFHRHLKESPISCEQQVAILKAFARYRMDYFQHMEAWSQSIDANDNLERVMSSKSCIAGNLMPTWCRIMNNYYNVPANTAKQIVDWFHEFAMYIQVIDDVIDLPKDQRVESENIAIAYINTVPNERHILTSKYVKSNKNLYFHQLKQMAPHTYHALTQLLDVHQQAFLQLTSSPDLKEEIQIVTQRLKHFQR